MPITSPEQFEKFLSEPEGTRLEFKSARTSYEFDKLVNYCVALANECGGTMILGVTDKRPRNVVGTSAFPEPGETEASLHRVFSRRIPIEEYHHGAKRVLIVHVPSRLPGTAWQHDGKYLKRAGDALVPMGDQELRAIFSEAGPDFSAETCGASLADLSTDSIAEFRRRWARKTQNPRIDQLSDIDLLRDAELLVDNRITIAALVLFGSRSGLGKHLAQAEIVFEYRSSDASGPAADREEYRQGFFSILDALWNRINLRNDRQSYQQDLFRYDIPTFDEVSIREALLNAVAHRDYRLGGSIFIRQYSRRLEIVSPGGFPAGVTAENIVDQQNPRNRRLAEALARAGLVERSGQGLNLMIENAIKHTKPLPDFTGTASHEVRLTLAGTVQNPAFIRYLQRLGDDRLSHFSTQDYMALDAIQRQSALTPLIQKRLLALIHTGAVESMGRGKSTRFFLSREMYEAIGEPGTYTRHKGLDHATNKALLLQHIRTNTKLGSPFSDLRQVLPALSDTQIRWIMGQLKEEGLIFPVGINRWARWHAEGHTDPA